jgi:CubicO group peptidase (beta-lactamase class C family)
MTRPVPPLADLGPFPERFPRTARVLEEGVAARQHLGAQVYVSRAGRTLASAALGERRRGDPMTTDTLVLWLSAGKPLTALAIAQQIGLGRLGLDEAVAVHVPEFGVAGKSRLTLRHLLTHTAGFRAADSLPEELPWDEAIRAICQTPIEPGWVPGASAAYQTQASWFILAEVVRRLDGRAFPHYVREEILLPLGLADTWIGLPPAEHQRYGPRIGTMHIAFPRDPSPHPTWDAPEACARCRPGSSARGPVAELGRFYEALLEGGRGIIHPEILREFVRRQRTGLFDLTFRHAVDFGLGFLVNSHHHGPDTAPYGYGKHASEATFGHSGSQSSCAFADPVHRLVVAWVCNGMPGEPRHQQRQRAVNNALYEDLGLG